MGQTLTNGIFLPNEGERNCYTGLESNWRAIDGYIGNYNVHAADLTIHVTAADKEAWNGKADASALTAHTGDTTIHVTAADKEAWNGKADASALTAHTGNTTIHVTAEDKAKWDAVTSKANDTDAVHKSGAESIAGLKTFTDLLSIDGDYLGTEASTNQRTNLQLRSNLDTAGQSAAFITRFRQNRVQGGMQPADVQKIGFDIMENETRTNNVFDIQCTGWVGDVPTRINFVSSASKYSFGRSILPCYINDLSPGALSLPNLSAGVDISSYITNLNKSVNTFTPPANGWIFIRVRRSVLDHVSIRMQQQNGLISATETADFSTWGCHLPVVASKAVDIYIYADGIASAYFFPCLGNI